MVRFIVFAAVVPTAKSKQSFGESPLAAYGVGGVDVWRFAKINAIGETLDGRIYIECLKSRNVFLF